MNPAKEFKEHCVELGIPVTLIKDGILDCVVAGKRVVIRDERNSKYREKMGVPIEGKYALHLYPSDAIHIHLFEDQAFAFTSAFVTSELAWRKQYRTTVFKYGWNKFKGRTLIIPVSSLGIRDQEQLMFSHSTGSTFGSAIRAFIDLKGKMHEGNSSKAGGIIEGK